MCINFLSCYGVLMYQQRHFVSPCDSVL